MDTGRLINKLSNCLRRRSAETQKRIHISGTKGQILNYILIESQKRPLVQRDVEQEFGLRPSTATEMLQALQAADLIRREPDPADARRKCIVCTEKAEAFPSRLPAGDYGDRSHAAPRHLARGAGHIYADRAENAFKF